MKNPAPTLVLACACAITIPAAQAAMTWHWNATPSAYGDQITASMDQCVATFNAYSNYDYSVGVIYSSGTPTADAGYLGQIRFGGQRNYRTAMHEASHWLGTGTVADWSPHHRFGQWKGTYAYNLRCAFDGPGERMGGDAAHYWPYGANQDSEGVDGPRMVGIIGAYRRDMNLAQGDRTIGIASGTYRLRNRQSIQMLDSLGAAEQGAWVKQNRNGEGASQQWEVSLLAGTPYFTLRNVATGTYLDTLGATADGSPIGLASLANGTPTEGQQWQIVATDSFFFKIVNRATGKVLDNLDQSADGTIPGQWPSETDWNQQWTFVHPLVQAHPEDGVVSQGRPVASSSAESANRDWKGNNGVAGDRWTASSGSYPQWWRVDLGVVQPVTKIAVDWFGAPTRTYRYLIEVSNDGANWTTALDKSNNTQAGATVDTLTNVSARYVRVNVVGASAGYAAFHECRVYNESQPSTRLLSQFRPATASSQQSGNLASNATDVDATITRWTAAAGTFPQWWQVDLGSVRPLRKSVIQWVDDGDRYYRYRVEGSADGVNFTTLADRTSNTTPAVTGDSLSGSARYVRVTVTGASAGWAGFYDAQIYGEAPAMLPAPWNNSDIGAVGAAGSTTHNAGTYTVVGSGTNTWGVSDEFHYAYVPASGDCTITARVTGISASNAWAKGGVMIRETLDANSRQAFLAATPNGTLQFIRRTATGGSSATTDTGGLGAPRWVRLTRTGDTITAAHSTNGSSWTTVGSQTIAMGTNLYIGLAVTARTNGTLATLTATNVTATP